MCKDIAKIFKISRNIVTRQNHTNGNPINKLNVKGR